MAIIRCPYCHAIIDETDKYCNNCGTQLLFAEDEEIEEEIPGEKILEAETEEKDYEIDEPESESRADEDLEPDEELPGESAEETEEIDLEDLIEEETVRAAAGATEERPRGEEGGEREKEPEEGGPEEDEEVRTAQTHEGPERTIGDEGQAREEEEETEEEKQEEQEEEEGQEEEEEEEEEEDREEEEDETRREVIVLDEPEEQAAGRPEEAEEPAAAAAEPALKDETADAQAPERTEEEKEVPATFDTAELEGLGKTVDLGKEKIDQLLEALAESEPEDKPEREVTPEPTGTLPPWASVMKGAPAFSPEKDTREAGPASEPKGPWDVGEEEIFPRKKPSAPTIGLPERVAQAALPFEAVAEEAAESESEEAAVEQAGEPVEREEPPTERVAEERPRGFLKTDRREAAPVRERENKVFEAEEETVESVERPPFNLSSFLKSKAFDILFVGLFWIVALWLAAHAVGATLFGILGAMSGAMILLYGVLVLMYFFLFKFFLGETLGERLFRGRD